MSPELWHLFFAAAGAAITWWIKQQGAAAAVDPALAGVLDALKGLHAGRQQRQAVALLRELTGGPAPPAA